MKKKFKGLAQLTLLKISLQKNNRFKIEKRMGIISILSNKINIFHKKNQKQKNKEFFKYDRLNCSYYKFMISN